MSQFHKTLLPSFIPDNKILVSSNGINLKDFNNLLEKRNPRRIIYTSSYDRGLVNLLDIWHDVIKEVPDAELHIFYGWETWIKMEQQGVRDPKIRIAMTKLMNQPGIYEHGRVGHKQLAKEFAKSGVYAYPCEFSEISCISAMKAQASLCVPVTTDYAALAETVKIGIKIKGKAGDNNEEFKKSLIEILKDEKRQEVLREELLRNKNMFSWELVAKQWQNQLFVSAKVDLVELLSAKG